MQETQVEMPILPKKAPITYRGDFEAKQRTLREKTRIKETGGSHHKVGDKRVVLSNKVF